MRKLVYGAVVISLLYSTSSMAINKCVDDNGRVSFQDKPCAATSTATTVPQQPSGASQASNSEIKIVDLNVGERKRFSIGLPADWKTSVKTPRGINAPTLRAQPVLGDDVILLMTFIPNPQKYMPETSALQRVMSEIDRVHRASGNEKQLSSIDIKQVFGKGPGKLNTYLDQSLANNNQLPKGEFMLVSDGAVVIDDVVIKITILTNDVASSNYKRAFAAVHAIIAKNK